MITDCVMAELEKLGQKYRIALRIARDQRFIRLKCDHKVYADDCLVERVMQHRVYIVATNDRDLVSPLGGYIRIRARKVEYINGEKTPG